MIELYFFLMQKFYLGNQDGIMGYVLLANNHQHIIIYDIKVLNKSTTLLL